MTNKRKFGFNIAPLKIPSKSENDALRKALDGEFSPVSSPDSPLVDRQYVSRAVQQELKAACRLLVEKTGNAHHNSQEDALLNFESLQRAAKHSSKQKKLDEVTSRDHSSSIQDVVDHRPQKSRHDKPAANSQATHISELSDKQVLAEITQQQYPVRKDSLSGRKHAQTNKSSKSLVVVPPAVISERPQTAPPMSDESSHYSPLSASTDYNPHSASSAFTSIPVTPPNNHSTKTFSSAQRPMESSHLRKVSNVIEARPQTSMTVKDQDDYVRETPRSDRSIVGGFKDFVRNRSRSRSRSREPSTLKRTASTLQSWKQGWNLRRKQSTNSMSDIGASIMSHGPDEQNDGDVNLNRALPPLPGLDTYQAPKEEQSKSRESRSIETVVRIQRPKTSGATATQSSQMKAITESPERQTRDRSASNRATARPATSTVPTRKFSIAESRASSNDSCFSPTGTDNGTPKRSMDIMKAAALARTQSIDNLRQQVIPTRKDSITANTVPKSSGASIHSSRPSSRGATRTPAKYSIIPHQRTPSQPASLHKSTTSSVVNLPPRPATRDATSLPTRSRMPSIGAQSTASAPCAVPPLPTNFSRKIDGYSRPTTSAGIKETPKPALQRATTTQEITALPPFPSKKHSGLRRIFSSISVRKPKNNDMPWMSYEPPKTSAGITTARG